MKKTCQICGRDSSKVEILSGVIIRPAVGELIKSTFSNWDSEGFICIEDLRKFRSEYLIKIMQDEKGELTTLEKDVIEKMTTMKPFQVILKKILLRILHLVKEFLTKLQLLAEAGSLFLFLHLYFFSG
jgi:hypothetical protein